MDPHEKSITPTDALDPDVVIEESLIEEVSIDGMCGVY
jgi:mycofactocin precursor